MTGLPNNRNPTDRNAEATVHIAHLDEKVTDALLWELMVQAGPVRHVYIPRNRITGAHFGYGFCEFHTPLDAHYASKVLNMVSLFSKSIRISQSTVDRVSQDVGANLFVGNLVDEVDEKLLHDAFSAFGPLIDAPYIMRYSPNAQARRYGFVKYARFDHSDAAIAAMSGQYICNQPITVQYAFKKDSDARERHGSQAERILAKRALQTHTPSMSDQLRPHTHFSDQPAKQATTLPDPQPNIHPPPVPMPPPAYAYAPQHPPTVNFPSQVPYAQQMPIQAWQQPNQGPNAVHPEHVTQYHHMNAPPPGAFPPFPPDQRTMDIGWSQSYRYPPHTHRPSPAAQYTAVPFPPDDAARPVADEQAPPPPST